MKALIKVGYGCNDHCTFCHTAHVRDIDGSAEETHRKIERAKQLGHSMVVLSGGEPTIRPELMRWAAHVSRLGMDLGLVTNGRLLSYETVAEKLIGHRLRYVYLSLHGGSARIHNRLVRSDAFDQSYGALANLTGRGMDLTANCVVTRQNVDHLRELVDSVLPYDDVTLKFSMVEPKGGGVDHFDRLTPRVSEAAEKVCDALRYGYEQAGRGATTPLGTPRFTHGAFPLCLMPGFEHLYDDLKTDRFWTMIEVGEPDFFPVDDLNKVQPDESCRGCALNGPCPGLYQGYAERFGGEELRAVTDSARSNSFNYRFERLVTTKANGGCPLRDGPVGITPWDRGRHLFVRNGSRIAAFRADTRDFSDAEIASLKHDAGQVYLDVSRGKDAPDDFPRDLVKLRRSDMCAECPEREGCTGMFEAVERDVFSEDDARVRELLGELEGDVLDIGCGEGPYEDVLAPLADAGRIRYVGVDPDAERIESLRARWPWAELHVGAAEELPDDGRRYDHVLVLRSWNHLRDPRRALRAVRDRLRPGGTLTVVDNIAFGLARTAAQTDRAEGSGAAFEHYRNDGAGDAHRQVAPLGLEPLERRDVGPATSNQWLLRYRIPTSR